MRPKVVVIVPAFNEAETVGHVISGIPRSIPGVSDVDIVIVNDGSTDETAIVSADSGADFILNHGGNRGLGTAFRNGLDMALVRGADIIVNIDADGQYDPREIPKLVEPILRRESDIVLGNRRTGSLEHMQRARKLGNRLATKTVRMLTGLPILDGQTGFRAFSREAALRLNLNGSYTYTHEVLFQAAEKRLRVAQVPITFRERTSGSSRLIPNLRTYAKSSARILIRSYRDYRPLKVFLSIGLASVLVGTGLGIWGLSQYFRLGTITSVLPLSIAAAVFLIVGFQTLVLGLLADMMRSHRHLQEEILYRLKRWESDVKTESHK